MRALVSAFAVGLTSFFVCYGIKAVALRSVAVAEAGADERSDQTAGPSSPDRKSPSEQHKDSATEIAELRRMIQDASAETEDLKAQVARLQSLPVGDSMARPPNVWQEGNINGSKYYIIPLERKPLRETRTEVPHSLER